MRSPSRLPGTSGGAEAFVHPVANQVDQVVVVLSSAASPRGTERMPRAQKATGTAKQAPAKKGAAAPSTAKKTAAKKDPAPKKAATPAAKATKGTAKAPAKKAPPAKSSS